MQTISSKLRYILDIVVIVLNVFIFNEAEKDEISFSTTCPAVIFAASRKVSVRGRIRVLVVSIKIRKGLSHSGVLFGSTWPKVFFME